MTDDLSDLTLVVLETAHIQSYIFNSNRLKENVGASYMVTAATEDWVFDLIHESELSHNLNPDWDRDRKFTFRTIEEHGLRVEVLYCGGGNAVLLFRQEADAKDFVGRLSRRAIIEAPGLHLTFVLRQVNWADGDLLGDDGQRYGLSYSVSYALRQLKTQRSKQPTGIGLAGLSVTAMCASTSLPAAGMDRDPDGRWRAISSEVHAKRAAAPLANKKLEGLFLAVQQRFNEVWAKHPERDSIPSDLGRYDFALELDDLGRTKGESSFIAVVHADGNDMGRLIQGLKTDYPSSQHNRKYIAKMRHFSENVKKAAQSALVEMLVLLLLSIREENSNRFIHGIHDQADIQLTKKDGQFVLPFRSLVSGGDDITFVCDGRIGLDMAVRFIKAFENKTREYLGQRLTACAGIAIVNAHYPFARAYDLAEELCQSAKQERYNSGRMDSSLIDWHYTTGGLYDDLDGMREREYQVVLEHNSSGFLLLRPLFLDAEAHPYRTWTQVKRIATEFQRKWRDHRSKAKNLMTALRGGDKTAQAFQIRYINGTEIALPVIKGAAPGDTWLDGKCLYYDALELMDLYIPITQGDADHVSED